MTELKDVEKSAIPLISTAEDKAVHAKVLKEFQQYEKLTNLTADAVVTPSELVLASPYQKTSQIGSQSGASERGKKDSPTKDKATDGSHTFRQTDGTLVTERLNGTKKFQRPDGTIEIEKPNLVKSTIKPDGTIIITRPNHLKSIIAPTANMGGFSVEEELGCKKVTTTEEDQGVT